MSVDKQIEYSVVIPVYNTAESLITLVNDIKNVFLNQIQNTFEIILIDDSSENIETWKTIQWLANEHKEVTSIQLMQNFGQQSATLCGIEHSKGNYIITMDDDLQHSPYDIPKLIEQKNHDIVIGYLKNKKHNILKKITSNIKGWFDYKLLKKPRNIRLSSFRLFKRNVAEGILQIKTVYPFIPALLLAVSKDIVNVKINHYKRQTGESGYTLNKMFKVFSFLIINNSSFLLNIVGFLGISLAIFSFIWAGLVIAKKLIFGIPVAGWTSLVVINLFIGGTLLFSVGIIGKYLIRIIYSIEKRPNYHIRWINKGE